jgi:hypothetical protein
MRFCLWQKSQAPSVPRWHGCQSHGKEKPRSRRGATSGASCWPRGRARRETATKMPRPRARGCDPAHSHGMTRGPQPRWLEFESIATERRHGASTSLSHSEATCRSSPTRCRKSGPGYTPVTRKPGPRFLTALAGGHLVASAGSPVLALYPKSGVPYYSNWCFAPAGASTSNTAEYLAPAVRGLFVSLGQATVLLGAFRNGRAVSCIIELVFRPLLLHGEHRVRPYPRKPRGEHRILSLRPPVGGFLHSPITPAQLLP